MSSTIETTRLYKSMTTTIRSLAWIILLISVSARIGFAQPMSETEALRKEVELLKDLIILLRLDIQDVKKSQIKVEKEVAEIKNLLQGKQLHARPQQLQNQEVILRHRGRCNFINLT